MTRRIESNTIEIFASHPGCSVFITWTGRLTPFSDQIVAHREIRVDAVYTIGVVSSGSRGARPSRREINDSIATMNNTRATVKRGSGSDRVRPRGRPGGNHP